MPGGMKEVVYSYGWYLRKYATDAREKGAHPIIVSTIPTRGFVEGQREERLEEESVFPLGERLFHLEPSS